MNHSRNDKRSPKAGRIGLSGLAATIVAMMVLSAGAAQAHAEVVTPRSDFGQTWQGAVSNARFGLENGGNSGLANLGDLNGDGIDDFSVRSANDGTYILFGPLASTSALDLSDLPPDRGYRITTPSNPSVNVVGDQNDDGLQDLMVKTSSLRRIIYSVGDPSALPTCDVTEVKATRCLDSSNPVDVDGKRLGFALSSATTTIFTRNWLPTDVDGDGKDELITATNANQMFLFANGLGSSCPVAPGLCTIDLDALGAPDKIEFDSPLPAGVAFAAQMSVADVNGDGNDDILASNGTDGSFQPGVWVIYGRNWTESPVNLTGMTASDGYQIPVSYSAIGVVPFSPGDVNGDGVSDIGIQTLQAIPTLAVSFFVVYGAAGTPERSVNLASPPEAGVGVEYDWDTANGLPSNPLFASLGDLNGDGANEFGIGFSGSTLGGANAGAVMVMMGGDKGADNVLALNGNPSPDVGLYLAGSAAGGFFGSGLASAGDDDGDGVDDLAIASGRAATVLPGGATPTADVGWAGVLSSSRYFPQGITRIAGSVDQSSAVLSGVANANRRESVASFEYGTTDEYGQTTADQSVGSSGSGRGFDAEVTGLTADTEYHYRAVVQNDLGIKAYGQDHTFKTAAKPVDPCDADDTLPNCKGYTGKKFCEAHPSDPVCQEVPPTPKVASLSELIANSHAAKVKRGKKGMVKAWITSTGSKEATGVKICAEVPKRLAKVVGKRCWNVGSLAPGKTAKAGFKIQVKAKARKGTKVKVKLLASAEGLKNETARVGFTVR